MALILMCLTLVFCEIGKAQGIKKAEPLTEWQGDALLRNEGAFYVKVRLNGFEDQARFNSQKLDLHIYLKNILNRKEFVLIAPYTGLSGLRLPLWRLKSGKYRVIRIYLVDLKGEQHEYLPQQRPRSLIIKRQTLSNFGLWTIWRKGDGSLGFKQKKVKNSFKASGRFVGERVTAVIDGFHGRVQKKLAGVKILKQAKKDYRNTEEMSAVYTRTREVAVYYKLDLFRDNRYAKDVMSIVQSYDPQLRKCYINTLDRGSEVKGKIVFRFILSKFTRSMRKLKIHSDQLKDPELADCLIRVLGGISFPVETNMLGQIEASLSFKYN